MGTSLEAMIPFAAGHEMIRQGRRDLTLVGPISDMLFDQLIGAGCVRKVRAAWVGNVITGSGYNFRRAVESGQLETEDHTNLTLAMALKAGAMGVSFMPTRTALGSDLGKTNPNLAAITCPFTNDLHTAVAAICPDVAVIHVQQADEHGYGLAWGNLGVSKDACLASRHIILTAEEIVPPHRMRKDPNRVLVPGFRVSAVVEVPWGGYPSPVPGYYNRDHEAFTEYRDRSTTPDRFKEWLAQWVTELPDHRAYLERVGKVRLASLGIENPCYSEPVNYGY